MQSLLPPPTFPPTIHSKFLTCSVRVSSGRFTRCSIIYQSHVIYVRMLSSLYKVRLMNNLVILVLIPTLFVQLYVAYSLSRGVYYLRRPSGSVRKARVTLHSWHCYSLTCVVERWLIRRPTSKDASAEACNDVNSEQPNTSSGNMGHDDHKAKTYQCDRSAKRRKYEEKFIQYEFTCCTVNNIHHPQCVVLKFLHTKVWMERFSYHRRTSPARNDRYSERVSSGCIR